MVFSGPGAATAAQPPPKPRGLAVSIPPDPAPAPKGAAVRIPIRIVNPGSQTVTAGIAQRAVLLGDNGHVTIGSRPDRVWEDRVTFAPATVRLPPRSYAKVVISVRVPAGIGSDLHFVGFLVSPAATAAGQVSVINQIGSFVTLDVPGPREAKLRVALQVPGFALARQARGTLEVANIGHSAVRFWGENDTTLWPGGSNPEQVRIDTHLAPVATTRTLPVIARPAWPVGFVTLRGQIVYPSVTSSATTQTAFDKRVLVIDPWVLVAVAILLLFVAFRVWLAYRRRNARRRSESLPTPSDGVESSLDGSLNAPPPGSSA
jgi:hypothetical protein